MLRVKNLPKTTNEDSRKIIADFFGLSLTTVIKQLQPDTYKIGIENNDLAKDQFKKIAPYGNGYKPGVFDFTKEILVMWNGTKILPV